MDFPDKLTEAKTPSVHSLQMTAPYLLIATPLLLNPNFERTVVLIVEHTSGGALGFVINRPTTVSVKSILPHPNEQVPPQLPAWYGGPVKQSNGIIMHNDEPTKGDTVLANGIVISSMEESLGRLIDHESKRLHGVIPKNLHRYRFIVGYAGWGASQLDDEIRSGTWEQIPANADLLFQTPWGQIWDKALGALGASSGSLVGSTQTYLN